MSSHQPSRPPLDPDVLRKIFNESDTSNLLPSFIISNIFTSKHKTDQPLPLALQFRSPQVIYPSVCTIGEGVTDNTDVGIGITERRSGLYILGKPRMGKSWLMVKLIIEDIKRGYGIFFLDPHGDAIDDLIQRIENHVLLFDPEDINYSFGINVLECPDIDNMRARSDTFAKAKGVFDKLWRNTFEDKPWLQMILQNTLYAFIENPGLTLVELPIFFRDREFRDYVVSNIRHNWQGAGLLEFDLCFQKQT